jgi:hypothetical protein
VIAIEIAIAIVITIHNYLTFVDECKFLLTVISGFLIKRIDDIVIA